MIIARIPRTYQLSQKTEPTLNAIEPKYLSKEGTIGYWAIIILCFIFAIGLITKEVKLFTKLIMLGLFFVISGAGGLIGLLICSGILGFLALIGEGDRIEREREAEKRSRMSPEERQLYDIKNELKEIKDELRWRQ